MGQFSKHCIQTRGRDEGPRPIPSGNMGMEGVGGRGWGFGGGGGVDGHTPSIAFRHLPPKPPRFSYATEGALFISAQLSTHAVSAPRKVRVLNMTVEAT